VFAAVVGLLILTGMFLLGIATLMGSSGRTRRVRNRPPWWRARS